MWYRYMRSRDTGAEQRVRIDFTLISPALHFFQLARFRFNIQHRVKYSTCAYAVYFRLWEEGYRLIWEISALARLIADSDNKPGFTSKHGQIYWLTPCAERRPLATI